MNQENFNDFLSSESTNTKNKAITSSREDIDDLIKNMEHDQGLISIIKSYQDYEQKKSNNAELNKEDTSFDSVLFSNSVIQSTFNKSSILKRVLMRKHMVTLNMYLLKWSTIKNNEDYLKKNRKVIEAYCSNTDNEDESFDYKNYIGNNTNNNYTNTISNSNKNYQNLNNFPLQPMKGIIKNKRPLCLVTKNTIMSKLTTYFCTFTNKLQNFISSKKLANNSLSLLYIFTELAISKSKNGNAGTSGAQSTTSDTQKLMEYEKKIAKYEACLNEKADIIAYRNDRIEQLNDTVDSLQHEIKRQNNKIEKLEKISKNLNVVEESLCSKCGNTLEESFIHKDSPVKSANLNEYKKTIQEQLDIIIKMENENKEIKSKNEDYKSRNEMILNELEIIKTEFKLLSENFSRKNIKPSVNINYSEMACQTEEKTVNKNNISNTQLKKSTKKYTTKLNLKNSNNSNTNSNYINTNASNTSITNYNININSNSSRTGINQSNSSFVENDKEIMSLKFDNSLLTQEIINLNKENTKLKNDFKQISDLNKKMDKEKNDFVTKFKTKSENFDKLKKENEDLMILIQTSNYKSFVSVESENKKCKIELTNLTKENENLKIEVRDLIKKVNEIEQENDKNKKISDNLNKFKNEREELVLENAKLDSEINQIKFELENTKNLIERQNILLKKQDETITKLNEDVNYLNYNSKKSKTEAERAIQDALSYQQIVRKLEKDLNDSINKRNKVENELHIIKGQLGIK